MDVDEIRCEISRLADCETTYANCERLAILSMAEERLAGHTETHSGEQDVRSVSADVPAEKQSYFLDISMHRPIEDVMAIMDRHMEAVRVLYPKEYDAVLRKIEQLE